MTIWYALKAASLMELVHIRSVHTGIHAVMDPFAAKKSSGLKNAKRRKKDKWRERLEVCNLSSCIYDVRSTII